MIIYNLFYDRMYLLIINCAILVYYNIQLIITYEYIELIKLKTKLFYIA